MEVGLSLRRSTTELHPQQLIILKQVLAKSSLGWAHWRGPPALAHLHIPEGYSPGYVELCWLLTLPPPLLL